MIPKTLHFIWLGKSRKPRTFADVFSSWKTFAPQFTLHEWDEVAAEEFRLPDYYYRSLKEKKYAFASDVLRFHVLHCYGGIYVDVDELLLKSIDTSELLDNQAFLAKYHESDNYFGFGVIGSVPHSVFSQKMIAYYEQAPNDRYVTVNKVGSEIALDLQSTQPQTIKVLPQEYFYPLNDDMITKATYGKHLANTSWIPLWKKFLHQLPFYRIVKKVALVLLPQKQKIDY